MNKHEQYMKRVLELAKKGLGRVNPNPLVACVIVKEDKIIAEDYHHHFGGFHAERNAINSLNNSIYEGNLEDACLYVNLEPCAHYGKTPPCTDIIIKSGIKKVVIGAIDYNEQVSGKGISILKNSGIEVVTGVLEKECLALNQIFYHYIQEKTPYVLMKYAMTMDGKIASYTGHSKWITSEASREHVHHTRHKYAAIMIGIGTVLKDDPMLTCRIENGIHPVRIICDNKLRIPLNSKILQTAKEIKTIIATISYDEEKMKAIEDTGAIVIKVMPRFGKINLRELMQLLVKMQIDSVIIEGGGELNYSALEEKIVHKVQTYIAPKIIGSNEACSPVGGRGLSDINHCFRLINQQFYTFDEDIMIESEVDYTCLQE